MNHVSYYILKHNQKPHAVISTPPCTGTLTCFHQTCFILLGSAVVPALVWFAPVLIVAYTLHANAMVLVMTGLAETNR